MNAKSLQAELDAILADGVAAGEVPHAAAIITDASGVIYQGQAGACRMDTPARPLTEDTVYWIHSMTKPITAAGVMQLVEQGRVGLDDDCGDLVPALARPKVLDGFDADGQAQYRPAEAKITLRRLLTHTAGFGYPQWNPNIRRWQEQAGYSSPGIYTDPDQCPPLANKPGSRWEYGINIDWAGKVLEAVTGETLEAYLRTNILEPLGMTSTGYVLNDDIRASLSGVHERDADGVLHPAELEVPDVQDPETFTGGGGMYGTAGDYARFMRMILNGGELDGTRVLAAETVQTMGGDHTGGLPVVELPAALPQLTYPMVFHPEADKRWGLSFMLYLDALPGRRRAGSLAWGGLRNTYFWIDPASGLACAFFSQLLPFADANTLVLVDRLEAAVYSARG